MKTADSGITWNVSNDDLGLFCVKFSLATVDLGYFSDLTSIHTTSDGGDSFSTSQPFPNVYGIASHAQYAIAANDCWNIVFTTDSGASWQEEITGLNLNAPEPCYVFITPGEECFLSAQQWRNQETRNPGHQCTRHICSLLRSAFSQSQHGDFRISSGSPIREITIVDSYGRSFYSASFRSTDLQFTLPGIHPGIYLFQLSLDGNVSQVIRLVIG